MNRVEERGRSDLSRWKLRCIETGEAYAADEIRYRSASGGLLEVVHDVGALDAGSMVRAWNERLPKMGGPDGSGVWRYRELVLPVEPADVVTMREGNTALYCSERLAAYIGLANITVKHEGQNPTASFKDRGMTVGVTMARVLGQSAVACASTGNTSASMAAYAAMAGLAGIVFVPAGGVALGKLSQALAYGATVVRIDGNFDDAMSLVQRVCDELGVYLLNSINPYRIEGQKAIGFELLHELRWGLPDWIVLPGGNLGNSSALFKGLAELLELGVIDRYPRIAVVQAAGASPLYEGFLWAFEGGARAVADPQTLASAIRIGSPVSWSKAVRAIRGSQGIVTAVSDDEIMEAKREVDGAGIGAEPASCAAVAGAKKLAAAGTIGNDASVVCVLTGHVLKDTDAVIREHAPGDGLSSMPIAEASMASVSRVVEAALSGRGGGGASR